MKAAYFTPFILTTAFVLSACVYEPEPFEASTGEISNTESNSNIGKFFAVNNQKQICNPSVSQDTLNFPASMLWLNFGGKLNVNAPDSIYTVSKVVQHDRLTVSDTAGNVRWYLMRDTAKGECQYQDPEWSTHKNFAVALRAYDVDGSKSCENLDYGIFAVRLSDKAKYFFYEKGISEFATPHLWIGDSASYDKKDSSVNAFFESDELRLVYVNKNDEVVFVEFSKNSSTNSKGKILKKTRWGKRLDDGFANDFARW